MLINTIFWQSYFSHDVLQIDFLLEINDRVVSCLPDLNLPISFVLNVRVQHGVVEVTSLTGSV